MANLDAPFGLRPVRHAGGGIVRTSDYSIASAYGVDIFQGDPVITAGNGADIEIGTAGGDIVGVFAGCSYIDNLGEPKWSPYWPASQVATDIVAYVYDDPQIVFKVQADTTPVAANIKLLADLLSGTGSTQTGQSGWQVGVAGTGTQVRLERLHVIAGNAYGLNAVLEVLIGEHELRANTADEGLTSN